MVYYRRKLPELIIELDDAWDGSNDDWFLAHYIDEVLTVWSDDLQTPMDCFRDVIKQSEWRRKWNAKRT
jgi:hypothetical protein